MTALDTLLPHKATRAESEVSVNIIGGNFVFLNREQVVKLIGNLVALLADLEVKNE